MNVPFSTCRNLLYQRELVNVHYNARKLEYEESEDDAQQDSILRSNHVVGQQHLDLAVLQSPEDLAIKVGH